MKTIKNLKAEEIRKSILQLAIQGKLVKQDPNDEPASELVKRIYAEKQRLIKKGKIKKDKNESFIFKGDDNCYYEKIDNSEPIKLEDLPFDIPDSWTWIRQKNICWLDNGDKVKGKKLPYLESKVIRGKSEPTYIDTGVIVGPECKVILVDGENSGEIMTPPFEGYMGSTFKIFSAVKSFNYEFLLFIFLLNKEKYKNSKIGAAIPHLNKDLFRESLIAVPPLYEQERIVAKIIECEPLIIQYSIAEEKLSKLEEEFSEKLKKSVLQYAIEGKLVKQDPNDEPASILLERIKTEKERLIKEGKIKRDKNESYIYQGDDKNYYENLPSGWAKTYIRNIISLTSGTDLTPNEYSSNNIGVPYLTGASNIDDNNSIIINRYTNARYINSHKNEILITCKGTIGKITINEIGDIHVARQFMSIRSFILNKYILIYLNTIVSNLNSEAKSMIPGIDRNQILTEEIMLPPIQEQSRIASKVNDLLTQISQ